MRDEIRIALDNVVFSKNLGKVLLIQRKFEPFESMWCLPAGHLQKDELLNDAALRELSEETGLAHVNLTRFGVFDAIDRDPRGRTISFGYVGVVNGNEKVEGGSDAQKAQWFEVIDLPKLAFDHNKIIEEALKWIQKEKRN